MNAKDQSQAAVKPGSGDHWSRPSIGSFVFEVQGAGYLEFGQGPAECGNARGALVECSWSSFGYSGGCMDRKEMEALRDYLTQYLDGTLEIIK